VCAQRFEQQRDEARATSGVDVQRVAAREHGIELAQREVAADGTRASGPAEQRRESGAELAQRRRDRRADVDPGAPQPLGERVTLGTARDQDR